MPAGRSRNACKERHALGKPPAFARRLGKLASWLSLCALPVGFANRLAAKLHRYGLASTGC